MAKKYIKSLNERFLLSDTETKPKVIPVVPKTPTRPARPIPTKKPSEKERTKPMGSSEPLTKPTIAPPTPKTPTRPVRPIPTKRPSEKERTKPMGEFKEVMDIFFQELNQIKNTEKGKEIIKNIHDIYVKTK